MSNIHTSAVVEAGAQVAPDAEIGPFCFVGRQAQIGSGTRLISHVSILGRTRIGCHNTIWPQATIGAEPQDLKFAGEDSHLEIGDHNDIRENVTIHLGTSNGGGATVIGSHNLLMVGCHIAHDCIVGNRVLLANNVLLAGHVKVEDYANVAGMVGVHHFCTIGSFSFVGGMTPVVKDVPPFIVFDGDPGREKSINTIGLERHGFSAETIQHLKDAFKRLFRSERIVIAGKNKTVLNFADQLSLVESEFHADENVQILCRFLRNRVSGTSGRYRETLRKDERRKRGFAETLKSQAIQPQVTTPEARATRVSA